MIALSLTILIASASALLTFVWPHSLLASLLAVPAVLILPGYALTSVVLRRKSFGWIERAAASVALSFALVVIMGVALNLTPWGLRASSWALLLNGVTVVTAGFSLSYRRDQLPEMHLPALSAKAAVVLTIMTALSLLSFRVAAPNDAVREGGFTELWVTHDAPGPVTVGVDNQESEPQTYRLSVREGNRLIKEWPVLALSAQETWTTDLPGVDYASLQVLLYRSDEPSTVYREVSMTKGDDVAHD